MKFGHTSLTRTVVTISLAAAIVGVPAAAMATPQQFPDGQSMVYMPCDVGPASLYRLDSATGDLVAIGSTPVEPDVCYKDAKFDPVSRELVTYDWKLNDWSPKTLIRVSPVSGEILGNINLVVDESDDSPDAGIVPLSGVDGYIIDSITYDSLGNLFVFLDDHKLYYASPTDDPDTLELLFLIDTPRLALASAEDPTNPGLIYALFEDNDYDIEDNRFYPFSITYEASVPVSATMGSAIASDCRFSCFVLNFDDSGVAWLQNELLGASGIYTTNFEGPNPVYTLQRALPWEYSYAVGFVPIDVFTDSGSSEGGSGSGLANTGMDSQYLGTIALGIVVVGTAFVLIARFRRISPN